PGPPGRRGPCGRSVGERPGREGPAAPGPAARDPAGRGSAGSGPAGADPVGARPLRHGPEVRRGSPYAGGGRCGREPAARRAPAEPPYAPEYDAPVRPVTAHEGFDPGDEPLDEVLDETTARQTSEQQALRLLQQALGAEKIGEVDHR